jgi:hypothetical protein
MHNAQRAMLNGWSLRSEIYARQREAMRNACSMHNAQRAMLNVGADKFRGRHCVPRHEVPIKVFRGLFGDFPLKNPAKTFYPPNLSAPVAPLRNLRAATLNGGALNLLTAIER